MIVDTEELRRLTREATPGPWERWSVTTVMPAPVHDSEANAALIQAMRNALPDLLDALDAKDAEIARLREVIRRWLASWDILDIDNIDDWMRLGADANAARASLNPEEPTDDR